MSYRMTVVAVLAAWSVAGIGAAPAATPGTAAAGTSRLAWELVRASGEQDAVVSPASVWEALAMTHAGARGETAAEIAAVLGMPDERGAIAAAAATLRGDVDGVRSETVTLETATRLWTQRGKPLDSDFTALLESSYGAAAGIVDFAAHPEDARAEINRWVGDHTTERIGELLAPGSVSVDTRVVLTSAVFMKALWDVPFEKAATAEGSFTLADGTEVAVPLMRRRARLIAGTSGSGGAAATICEIPYDGERLVMVLVVPTAREGLPAVLAGLDGDWRESVTAAKRRQVVLALPRWTSRQRLSLKAALESLGMRRAFVRGRADFSGVNGGQDLVVSDVVHEGFVEVTEEGTEAAAATGVVIDTRSAVAPEKPLEVIADRPFAWAIVAQRTGAVLFAGTVTDPR